MGDEHLTDKEWLTKAESMKHIGVTDESFEYLHPDGNVYEGKFEFYWNPSSGAIDVCHRGCNGSVITGRTNEDGSVAFGFIPRGYPDEETFAEAFKKQQAEYLQKQKQ